jgi:hypothetical protein
MSKQSQIGLVRLELRGDMLAEHFNQRMSKYDKNAYARVHNLFADREIAEAALALMGGVVRTFLRLDSSDDSDIMAVLHAFYIIDGIIQTADEHGDILTKDGTMR